jgi:hypothetical protein
MMTMVNISGSHMILIAIVDLMEVDAPPTKTGDQADVESEGERVQRRSRTPEGIKDDVNAENPTTKSPIEILDDDGDEEEEDDEEEGDEETFAVEKVLNHRIGRKANVNNLPRHPLHDADGIIRVEGDFNITLNGLVMTRNQIIPGRTKRIVKAQKL